MFIAKYQPFFIGKNKHFGYCITDLMWFKYTHIPVSRKKLLWKIIVILHILKFLSDLNPRVIRESFVVYRNHTHYFQRKGPRWPH